MGTQSVCLFPANANPCSTEWVYHSLSIPHSRETELLPAQDQDAELCACLCTSLPMDTCCQAALQSGSTTLCSCSRTRGPSHHSRHSTVRQLCLLELLIACSSSCLTVPSGYPPRLPKMTSDQEPSCHPTSSSIWSFFSLFPILALYTLFSCILHGKPLLGICASQITPRLSILQTVTVGKCVLNSDRRSIY